MGLKRWNGTSWVPTIYQPSLSASEILNDSTVTGGNVKAALESLAAGGGGGEDNNVFIARIYGVEDYEEGYIITGPTVAELKAAVASNKQILVKFSDDKYEEYEEQITDYYHGGLCTQMLLMADDFPELPGYMSASFYVFKKESPDEERILKISCEAMDTEAYWGLEGVFHLKGLESTNNKDKYSLTSNSDHYPSSYVLDQMVPISGTTGYFLQKGSNGNTWAQVQSSGGYFFTFTVNYTDTFTVSGFPSYNTLKNQIDSNKSLIGYGQVSGSSIIWVFNLNKRDSTYSSENLVFTFVDLTIGTFNITVNSSGTSTQYRTWDAFEYSTRKVSSWSSTTTNTNYPSEKLVKDSLDVKISAPSGGNTGDVLKKTSSGTEWSTVQFTPAVTSATLTTAGWSSNSQTINVTGITTINTVVISPAPASTFAYDENKLLFTVQGNGTATFTCETVPDSDITVYFMIFG